MWREQIIIYVDIETGEIITRKEITNKKYRKVKKQIRYGSNTRETIYECRRHEQRGLWE